jgi:dTDP-4-dehydrorhamnose 3,5-epimerase
MTIRPGPIDGLWIIERPTFPDERGFFRETFRLSELADVLGQAPSLVQENHSRSRYGTLRGLHAENWEKLVYAPHGEVFTAVADLRPDSPTFCQVATFRLGGPDYPKVYVPRGFAHGFCVLSDEADYVYQVTEYYKGDPTPSIAWNDPDLAVPWPVSDPLLSPQDARAPTMRELFPDRFKSR